MNGWWNFVSKICFAGFFVLLICAVHGKGHSVQHSVVTSSGETITIETSFDPSVLGIANMVNQNTPVLMDAFSGLEGTFQENATKGVMSRGSYAISVEHDTQGRFFASGEEMSGAGSLKSVGMSMGQGIALQGEKWPTRSSCLIFDATQSSFQKVGMQIYAAANAAYPQALWVKLDLHNGQSVIVDVATLLTQDDWPEGEAGKGYGYLTAACSVPFDRLYVGFDIRDLKINDLYAGGIVTLATQNTLVNLPGFPMDQIDTILGNTYAYSAVSANAQQPLAANQLLGLDCIQQNGCLSLGLDPRSLFSLFQQDTSRKNSAMSKANTLTVHTLGIGQSGRGMQSGLKALWVTWRREYFKNWSAGILGGYSQDRSDSIYNRQYTQYQWAGLQIKRQRADGLGLSWVQNILFARNYFFNTRTVALFQMQAAQKYSGYTGSTVTQLQWGFQWHSGWRIGPYGRVAYAWQRRKSFQETMFSNDNANDEAVVLAQNSALEFNRNFTLCMVQECGVLFKKSWANDRFQAWFSGGFGRIRSLRHSLVQVGFVGFSPFFQVSPEQTDRVYLSPSVGMVWYFHNTWCLNMGASMEKNMGNPSSPNRSVSTWSVWCSVNTAF